MANRKEYEMLLSIGAQMTSSFGGTFKAAQKEISSMQKEIDAFNKMQSNITSYQKQQAAIDSTNTKLQVLKKQYDNLQTEQKETGDTSAATANKLIAQEYQISKTTNSLEAQKAKLQQLSDELRKAGVNMEDLSGDSAKLTNQINALRVKQEEAADGANNFGAKAATAFGAVQDALTTAGITVALQKMYDYFKSCTDAASEFEFAIAKIETVAGAGSNMQQISDDMVRMSEEMGKAATELSEAGYEAISSGVDASKAADFVNKAGELAVAGFTDSKTAVDLLTTILNAYGKAVEDTKQISDELIVTQNLGKTTVDRLASSMGMVIPTAAAYKISLEDVNAAYALMTIQGVSTERTTTYLNSMFNELGDSSSKVSKILDDMTGESFAELMASGKSLGDVLSMISQEVNGNTTAYANLWGSQEAQRAALSLLNVGTKEYNDTLQEMRDSAGATDTAYKIMADTAVMAQKRFEESANALKIAIGEDLSPALNELREMGTEAFGWAAEFAREHPTTIKMLAAVAAEVGVVALAVGAYNTVTKVSTALKALNTIATAAETAALGAEATAATGAAAATTVFNTALKINPIVAVVSVIATLTAGIIALTEATKTDADEARHLTESSRKQYEELQELNAEYERSVALHGDNSDETKNLRYQIENLTEEYESSRQTMEDYASEVDATIKASSDLIQSHKDAVDEINHQEYNTLSLIDKLAELAGQNEKTAESQEQMKAIIDELNQSLPKLGLSYDEIISKGSDFVESLKAMAKAEAAQKRYNKAYTDYVELSSKATDIENEIKKATDDLTGARDRATKADAAYWDELKTRSMFDTSGMAGFGMMFSEEAKEANAAQKEVEGYEKALADANTALEANKKAQEEVNEIFREYAGPVGTATEGNAALSRAISDVTTEAGKLAAKYEEVYTAALDSIRGQYSLWDEAAKVVATSSDTMNSALESQTTYWQKYNENLAILADKGKDIEGLSEMLASFADGSADSANVVAGMAQMAQSNKDGLKDMVKNWQDLQAEQENVGKKIGDLRLAFGKEMDALQKELADTISNMKLGDEAAESGKKTMEGFIKGAEDMLPEIQAAYARIAAAANEAMATASGGKVSVSVGVDGSHAAGLDYVPYDGYIAQLHQGERVLTANEASAYSSGVIETTAMQAESGSGAGSSMISPTFNVTYNVSGNNAEEVVSGIAKYDHDLKEFIIEVMDDTARDRRRRAYV